ncbi:MAG: hypothetical protein IKD15_00630 [Clostridia bacterium]|nr:hypothetical protein [Clostridia bacterium]
MKTFKKLAVLSMALLFAFGLSALTACNGGDSSSSIDSSVGAPASESDTSSEESKTYDYYEFTVLDKDGNKVADSAGYKVQLCTADNSNCYNPVATVNGVCVYNVIPNNTLGEYVVHVLNASYQPVELKEAVTTSADAFGAYTLQLAN